VRKLRLRKGSIPLFIVCFVSILTSFISSPVKADSYTTSGANDFYFTFDEPQNFSVRTYAQQYGIDSMLWLYDSQDNVLTANDDYYGLDSNISINLQPGTYRLRTGVCCGDPNRWYGQSYSFETSTSLISNQTTTTTTTTTLAPYLNNPQNLEVTSTNESKVYLSWTAPEQSNVEVERYAIFWSCNNWESGFAISSTTTSAIIENLESDQSCKFKVRADNDSLSVYSGWSNEVIGLTLPTTTTTTTTTTTLPPTTTTVPVTTTTLFFQLPLVTTTTTTTTTTTVAPTTTTTTTTTSSTTTIPPTTTTLPAVITEEITPDQAVDVATSPEVLKEISKEDAQEVFDAIDTSTITEEEKGEIIEAVQNAPDEVKEAFEGEINIYAEGFDEYVPVGSEISVKNRRTLLAAMGAVSAITVVGGSSGSPTPSGGNSNNNNGGGPNSHFKKDEEESEEEEEAPEIEGPEGGDDGDFTRNSIFKYTEEGMKKFSIWNFIKKFSRETAALAFTISSTVIVFATLSGDTRKITLIATSIAFLIHYLSVMAKNDE